MNVFIVVDVCEDIFLEEVFEINDVDIKDRFVMKLDEEVDLNIESFDSIKVFFDNNDLIKVSKEDDLREEKNEIDGVIFLVVFDIKYIGVIDCVES